MTQAGRLPDFLIIGAAKSGTTALYQYLTGHPRIHMSPIKEPCFFDPAAARGDLAWYRGLFEGAGEGQLCGEASTNYTRYPQVPDAAPAIAALLPRAKLIYIMRHPVERAYSHFLHRHTKEVHPGEPFRVSFEEFVARDPMCLDSSDYRLQLAQYQRLFPREALLLLLSEDLEAAPGAVLDQVASFLGIEPEPAIAARAATVNQGARFREHKLRQRMTAPVRGLPIVRALVPHLPRAWRDLAYAGLSRTPYGRRLIRAHTPPPMRPETRSGLLERYRESNRAIAALLGRDLSHWDQ